MLNTATPLVTSILHGMGRLIEMLARHPEISRRASNLLLDVKNAGSNTARAAILSIQNAAKAAARLQGTARNSYLGQRLSRLTDDDFVGITRCCGSRSGFWRPHHEFGQMSAQFFRRFAHAGFWHSRSRTDGKKQLLSEHNRWSQLVGAIAGVLNSNKNEA